MKTYLDWSAYDNYGMGDAYSGIPATGGAYAKAVAVCIGSRQCQRTAKGLMCPSFRATEEFAHSTQARVQAFKAALNGELGPTPFTHPDLAEAMDLCVACKGCKKECPNGVDMALIKTEFLAQKHALTGASPRTRLFAHLPRWLTRRRLLRALVRLRNGQPGLAWLGERLLGITARRPLPEPAPVPFAARYSGAEESRPRVALFVDTMSRHYAPEIPAAAVDVLTAAGYQVEVLGPAPGDPEPRRALCCGRTYLSNGLVEEARAEARRVLAAVRPALEAGIPVVGLEPACLYALKDDFYSLALGEDVARLAKQCYMFEEFLMREKDRRGFELQLKPLDLPKALLHGHCHQKAFGATKSLRKVLGWIPGFEFELVEASCCGMGGSFGYEAEHDGMSRKMAELSLMPAIRQAPEAPILADGFSCRHQIEDCTGRRPMHIAVLLQQALA
ncbi:(Fe-S)-binding protein [Azovibrio restrictus]|uniref:(Fe-S)-binding protein n=1 Tax=Azovibrio restrictus TaxID=146938 RepID=UPI0026E94938|nr:(Fe-S)-binding protein [Azovibrio restrictus]MDD3482563.1 (Fe-S)-binding protein [Azovibrio restrictus]